jgi:deoxyadenosine/deoxycytidine kinase
MRRYIVIEGLIGVGKTSLCRILQEEHAAELVLEPHEDNPFLEAFYRDPARYALPVQMYFLLTRWKQIDRIRQLGLFHDWVVSDYLFEKDRLFAEKTLSPEELDLYDRFAASLGRDMPTPDLVVVLDAPTPVLLRRIRERGIAGEDRIQAKYLDDLRERYDAQWARWTRCPILRIDNDALDYTRDPQARNEILQRIARCLELDGVDPSEAEPLSLFASIAQSGRDCGEKG